MKIDESKILEMLEKECPTDTFHQRLEHIYYALNRAYSVKNKFDKYHLSLGLIDSDDIMHSYREFIGCSTSNSDQTITYQLSV